MILPYLYFNVKEDEKVDKEVIIREVIGQKGCFVELVVEMFFVDNVVSSKLGMFKMDKQTWKTVNNFEVRKVFLKII